MDYKEEYQKALERAKKGLPIDEVFPELKESEDERIRKALIHLINEQDGFLTAIDGISVKDIITYLEKQKEQKLTECTSDSVLQKIKRAITSCRELSEHYKDTKENFYQYYGGKADGLQLALAYFGNKNELAEQKPAEWSEEDEKNIEKLDGFLSEVFCFGHVNVSQKDKEELQSWLKFLPERFNLQPKQEWSEEDEVMCEAILNTLERVGDYGTIGMQKDWLKSLKDRGVTLIPSSWKPSKEQMETLKNCAYGVFQNGDGPALRELYNDLEKLYYE